MRFVAISFAFALSLFSQNVLATDAPFPNLTIPQGDERLEEATRLLDDQKPSADYWEYGWGTFDTGTMVYSLIEMNNDRRDSKDRDTDIVNASESLIGLADVIFRPLPAFNADDVCPIYPASESERMQCLAAKERLLADSAERAHEPYEWLPHLENAGFNLVASLLVLHFGGPTRALVTAVPGELIGEAQLWSTPSGPMSDFANYKVRFSPLLMETGHPDNPAMGVGVSWRF